MGFFDSWKCNVKTFVKNPILYPGNIIEGYVEITAKSEIEFVAVRLKLTGKEMTCIHFHDHSGDTDYDEPDVYMQSSTLYKQLVTLAGATKQGGDRTSQKMPAGTWTYPFAFQLPMDLPPSFDHHSGGDFADCAYYIKAYIDIPGGFQHPRGFLLLLCHTLQQDIPHTAESKRLLSTITIINIIGTATYGARRAICCELWGNFKAL